MAYRILIIDDSPVARKVVRRALGMTGLPLAEVLEAGSAIDALELLRLQWVDLVLCDVHMPEMNGQEFVEHAQRQEALRTVPVIIVSSDTTATRREALLGAGAVDYLHKPITPERLRTALLSALYISES